MSNEKFINKITCANNVETMKKMDSESVHLIVTSPPYFADMEYEDIKKNEGDMMMNWNRYINEVLFPVFEESYRLLVPGGHLWINIDDTHSSIKSQLKKNVVLPTHSALIMELVKKYDYKEMILWKKIRGKHASGGSGLMMGSYGRFGSPGSIPIVQEAEYILWFKKPGLRKDLTDERRKESSLSFDQFKTYGMQIWEMNPVRRKQSKHPAAFPVELPKRCILLGSFKGDTILDPFGGSGTTAIASMMTERNYISIDREQKYCDVANERIAEFIEERDNPRQPELPFPKEPKKKVIKKKVVKKEKVKI